MAAGDVLTFIADVDDDGTKLNAILTGNGILVADDITMAGVSGSRVVVVVIKAA